MLSGGTGDDLMQGGHGFDDLLGGSGRDTLIGGGNADRLTGGEGNDLFRWLAPSESTANDRDVVLDFRSGVDKLDLSAIDANSMAAGDQAFRYMGASGFSGIPGDLNLTFLPDGVALVFGDIDGDFRPDFVIEVREIFGQEINSGDFIL